jgi:hypothetical protein
MAITSITAQDVLNAVLDSTETQREHIQNAVLTGALADGERASLRTKLLDVTEHEYPAALEQSGDESVGWTRTWLFSLLAIICDDDQPARQCLLMHLDPNNEPNPWVSYWLLYGLIKVNSPLLDEAAKIARDHTEALVSMLSLALEARKSSALKERQAIETALSSHDWDQQWAALRALRWVILQNTYPTILQALCRIVDDASDEIDDLNHRTYDAIIALGNIQAKTEPARRAAEVLERFVSRARRHPQRTPERCKAIIALGDLRVEKVDLLLDELIVDDPTLAREAALALEKMLETRRAVGRIFEKAQAVPSESRTFYADALRWMVDRQQVFSALDSFWGSGQTGVEDVARDLMSRVGGALAFERLRVQRDAMDNFTQLMKDTQENVDGQFNSTIEASRFGFRIQTWMDRLVFGVGLVFIIFSGIKAFANNTESDWTGIALTGGVGILGVLYSTLIARPRENIKVAVLDQSQLQMIFLGYIRDLNRVDQAYIEQILEDEPLSAEQVQKFISITSELRTKAVEDVNKLRAG